MSHDSINLSWGDLETDRYNGWLAYISIYSTLLGHFMHLFTFQRTFWAILVDDDLIEISDVVTQKVVKKSEI